MWMYVDEVDDERVDDRSDSYFSASILAWAFMYLGWLIFAMYLFHVDLELKPEWRQ